MQDTMEIQTIIQFQITQYYAVIAQERENRVKVRNWAITIWLAYIALLASGKIIVSGTIALFILTVLIVFFWAMEAFHQSLVLVNEKRVKELEIFFSDTELPRSLPVRHLYINGYKTITQATKISCFLRAFFTSEPIVFFHLAMVAASYIFVHFVQTPNQPFQGLGILPK